LQGGDGALNYRGVRPALEKKKGKKTEDKGVAGDSGELTLRREEPSLNNGR